MYIYIYYKILLQILVHRYDMIYLLTAIGLTPGDNSTVHIYTQTIHRTTQLIWEECGPCPVFANYILAFALQLTKKAQINLSEVLLHCLQGAYILFAEVLKY
jgi:uncharacterized integral membrane protein